MALEGYGVMDGQRHFAALRRAIGVPNPEHTGAPRFKPLEVTLGVSKGRNVISTYGEWAAQPGFGRPKEMDARPAGLGGFDYGPASPPHL